MDAQDALSAVYKLQFKIQGPEFEETYLLPAGISIIGRQSGCDLRLQDPQVSRRHAQVECLQTAAGLECRLTDLGSSNGTFVNGEPLTAQVPVQLQAGALVKISVFSLTLEAVALEAPPSVKKPQAPPLPEAERVSLQAAPPGEEPPSFPPMEEGEPEDELVPPGLSIHSRKLINYLPGIYHTDFMARFLGIFEAILAPLEWNIENFDLFLEPGAAPQAFLPWLENWFLPPAGLSWSEAQRRQFLKEAHQIYARRGTRWALSRVLEIYLGREPTIIEHDEDLEAHTFRVEIPLRRREVDPKIIEALIDLSKPAHTTYRLGFLD